MPSWFLKSETQWMIDKIPAYIAFDRNERVVYNGRKVTAMKAFMGNTIEEFGQRFPYRHLDTPLADIRADLRPLRATCKEWAGLHQKFRHRFNYLKGVHTGEEVGNHEEEDGDEGESEDGGSEEWETESNGDTNQGTGTEHHNF